MVLPVPTRCGKTRFETLKPVLTRAALLAFAFLSMDAIAQAQNKSIMGKIRSTNGTTVNDAIVELRVGGGGIVGQTVTRNDGDFSFGGLTGGEYEVAITVAGYEPAVQVVRFSETGRMSFAEVLNVEVMIKPKPNASLLAPPGTSYVQNVPKPARAAYEKAVSRLRDGKPEEAVALFREAIADFNEYFDAHFALGKELFRQGKDKDALEELERARQINDRQDAVFFVFGMVMLKQQKFVVAEFAFRETTRLNPNNVGSHYYRGLSLIEIAMRGSDESQRTRDLAEAEKELTRALDISDKRLSAVYYQRARIYQNRGDNTAAVRELESLLKAEPDAKNAATVRAMIEKLRGEKK